MKAELAWQKYKYFPYERELAIKEVACLLGNQPQVGEEGLEVELNGHSPQLLERLTYIREVRVPGGERVIPLQARLEASCDASKRDGERRQKTRYSAHGLHEYRGKFNPQVVRAVANIIGLAGKAAILDPFCGSGTSLLEAAHNGWDALGTDRNPLAVEISNAKIVALQAVPGRLQSSAARLSDRLQTLSGGLSYEDAWSDASIRSLVGRQWTERVPNHEYLSSWFPRSVLAQASLILRLTTETRSPATRAVCRMVLSDLARVVSLQDPGDLRIRRRRNPAANYPLIPLFVSDLERKVRLVAAARRVIGQPRGNQKAVLADCTEPLAGKVPSSGPSGPFDAAITSPPYASALPYVDTQRLSLCLLDLTSPEDLLKTEKALIGAREITGRERLEVEELVEVVSGSLPATVMKLCASMLKAVRGSDDGFRRKNVPALVMRYFLSMAEVLGNIREEVTPNGSFALVLGKNRSILGGREFEIDTPRLLADVALMRGWDVKTEIALNTYQRFDIHSRNSIVKESLLVLQRRD